MNAVLLAIVAYVLAQFAVGAWVSRRMRTAGDYILAGRKLGTGLVIFSVFATFFGAEAIVASGGAVYEKGLAGALADPFSYAIAIIVVGLLFAGALWSRGITTFADLFRQRYSQTVERLVVFVLLPGSLFWAAAQIRVFGRDPGTPTPAWVCRTRSHWRQCWWPRTRSSEGSSPTPSPTPFKASSSWLASSSSASSLQTMSAASRRWLRRQRPPALYSSIPRLGCSARWRRWRSPSAGPSWRWRSSHAFSAPGARRSLYGTVVAGVAYLIVGMIPVFLGLAAVHLLLVRATPAEMDAFIGTVRIDRGFRGFVRRFGQLGHGLIVVSDGLDRTIRTVLDRADIDLPYFANHLQWRGGDRWRLTFPHAKGTCATLSGNCKCSFAEGRPRVPTIMVGDGRSDFCVAGRADLGLTNIF